MDGWWRQAVVYQVYPRSFADSNADGVGDLRGVVSRVPYLADLGVDAVWLSPFYPSALADGGYDVDDPRAVDPRLGTLDDFDALVAAIHAAGQRIVVDIVPNHTSNRHAWFRAALASPPGSQERDHYVFRRGQGVDGGEPPTDWESYFGGPAWEPVGDGDWYLHLFAPEQPDLNWQNADVHADFLTTLCFWADRGVDGFRIDVAHGLAKDLTEPLPSQAELADLPPGAHPFEDRDEVHEIYAEWRRLFNSYDPPRSAVAEAWVPADRLPRYARPDGLGQAFNFDLLRANWSASEFRTVIDENVARAASAGSSSTWVLSNHDVVRHASRYGLPQGDPSHRQDGKAWLLTDGRTPPLDRALGLRRARAATLLMLALPGSAYLYQGEELGLHEVADLAAQHLQDPTFRRSHGTDKGRDGSRVPLPWTSLRPSFGFGANGSHLPQPPWFADVSVQRERLDSTSTLALYRAALRVRRRLLTEETLTWVHDPADTAGSVLHLVRPGGWHSVTNFGPDPVSLPNGTIVVGSGSLVDGWLPTDTTVWIV